MPTIHREKGYRFFFYINDHEPPHIHVEKGRCTAKFLLENTILVRSKRFKTGELIAIREIITKKITLFKSKWDEHITNK